MSRAGGTSSRASRLPSGASKPQRGLGRAPGGACLCLQRRVIREDKKGHRGPQGSAQRRPLTLPLRPCLVPGTPGGTSPSPAWLAPAWGCAQPSALQSLSPHRRPALGPRPREDREAWSWLVPRTAPTLSFEANRIQKIRDGRVGSLKDDTVGGGPRGVERAPRRRGRSGGHAGPCAATPLPAGTARETEFSARQRRANQNRVNCARHWISNPRMVASVLPAIPVLPDPQLEIPLSKLQDCLDFIMSKPTSQKSGKNTDF
ncbi:PREDICTED: uncharacterized protein LOC105807644 [Propithecus coquereli]|uniref:uncharacterized protein LOC105807644 n=1 Tax=Propithecus coquereli TaxID=379532 RepID=UPI00063FB729|nr:PREDICTED: uncharacterized protein LOC105807644 [Propithecus coquereli]